MTLVEMVNNDPQLARAEPGHPDEPAELPTKPAAFVASLSTAGVAAGAVAKAPTIGRAID